MSRRLRGITRSNPRRKECPGFFKHREAWSGLKKIDDDDDAGSGGA